MTQRSVRAAGFVRRAAAMLVDVVAGAGVIGICYALHLFDAAPFSPPPGWFWTEWWLKFWLDEPSILIAPAAALLVIVWAGTALTEAFWGRTPGDVLLGERVVDGDGETPARWRVLVRAVGTALNLATLGLGWFWILVSPTRRGWHDLLSGTQIVVE